MTAADKAEAAAAVVNNEASVATAAATVQQTVQIPPGPAKSNLLKRVVASLADDDNFSEARQTALADDAANQLEKARTLVLIARAERASKQTRQAWWTLHEAQQIALQLTNPDSVVAVFREIGAVETGLIRDAGGKGATQLNPGAGDVISSVLDYGVPPQGYHEMEVLRNGGGPLREPTIVRHQYFYNGDRYFQGPVLRGGPTIVQAVHPRTQS